MEGSKEYYLVVDENNNVILHDSLTPNISRSLTSVDIYELKIDFTNKTLEGKLTHKYFPPTIKKLTNNKEEENE